MTQYLQKLNLKKNSRIFLNKKLKGQELIIFANMILLLISLQISS